jgi:Uncharacterized protein containing a von Willebrand factor type A (vWA) domain
MRTNLPAAGNGPRTHQGGPAITLPPIDQLRRTVLACLLWESSFYESGEDVADRIKRLVPQCDPLAVADLAVEARSEMQLRHAPLYLVRELTRHPGAAKVPGLVATALFRVIQRADELAEFLALYWANGRVPIAAQVKKGLARAFTKFDEYQLAKYNRPYQVKLADVLRMVRPKPADAEQGALWGRLLRGELKTPDTWEVALSSGADKRETFERLLREGKLGYVALLRNLRNMHEAGVDEGLVRDALLSGAAKSRALPFQFIAAARAVPAWEEWIDAAMGRALLGMPKMPGKTVLLVDVSGSMNSRLSRHSDLTRLDAACALAILVRGIAESARVLSFSDVVVDVPPRSGMALADAITRSQPHMGTYLGIAVAQAKAMAPDADRLIVITDEQSTDAVVGPGAARGYMVNVGHYANGVGYGKWTRITGFSPTVVRYIQAIEAEAERAAKEAV